MCFQFIRKANRFFYLASFESYTPPTQCTKYSAFANSCPLQTDTFLFSGIHSHNLFKQVSIVLWKIGPINTTYGFPPQGLSVLGLREVRENSRNLSTFSLLLEKPNVKNPCSYRVEHVKVVFMLIGNAVPCCAFRGISL